MQYYKGKCSCWLPLRSLFFVVWSALTHITVSRIGGYIHKFKNVSVDFAEWDPEMTKWGDTLLTHHNAVVPIIRISAYHHKTWCYTVQSIWIKIWLWFSRKIKSECGFGWSWCIMLNMKLLLHLQRLNLKLVNNLLFFSDFLREDTPVGTSFLRAAAHDDDQGSNAAITYSLSIQNPAYLHINPSTGWIYVNHPISQVRNKAVVPTHFMDPSSHLVDQLEIGAAAHVPTKAACCLNFPLVEEVYSTRRQFIFSSDHTICLVFPAAICLDIASLHS